MSCTQRQTLKLILPAIACLLFLGACTTPPVKPQGLVPGDYRYLIKHISWLINKEMAKYNVEGLSIALVDEQDIIWSEGFGYADGANKTSATPTTIYRIGSISKIFTAVELIRLAEHGRVDIDKPLTEYLPQFSIHNRFTDSQPITLRALLAHHSGLPSDVLKGMWVDHPISLAQFVRELRNESLASPPQTQYKYSNIDYSLLGRIIEKVEQQDFAVAMQQNLLNPLGMTNSSFALTPDIEKHYSEGYRQGMKVARTPLRDLPAGSMFSNVEDMARFLQFLFAKGQSQNTRIVGSNALSAMYQPQYEGLPLDFGHKVGLGWMLSGLTVPSGDRLAWHNGGAVPFQAHLSLLPDKKLGVVILANTDEAAKFITQLGIKALELATEAKFGTQGAVGTAPAEVKSVTIPNEVLARYTGKYVMFNGQLGAVELDGKQLKTTFWGQNFSLVPTSHDTFVPKVKIAFGLISIPLSSMSVQFQTVAGKDFAVLQGLPAPFAFEKAIPTDISQVWLDRLGRYRTDTSEEIFDFKDFELALTENLLVANLKLSAKNSTGASSRTTIVLKPISNNEAAVVGIGNGEGSVLRASGQGAEAKLYYSGFQFERIGNK